MTKVYVIRYEHKYGTDVVVAATGKVADTIILQMMKDNIHDLDEDDQEKIDRLIQQENVDELFYEWSEASGHTESFSRDFLEVLGEE